MILTKEIVTYYCIYIYNYCNSLEDIDQVDTSGITMLALANGSQTQRMASTSGHATRAGALTNGAFPAKMAHCASPVVTLVTSLLKVVMETLVLMGSGHPKVTSASVSSLGYLSLPVN